MVNHQTSGDSLDKLILQIFEEQEDKFSFPLTTQKQTRDFVRLLNHQGFTYEMLCEEIGEKFEAFRSWRLGSGPDTIGRLMMTRINKPLQEAMLSDGEDENEKTPSDRAVKAKVGRLLREKSMDSGTRVRKSGTDRVDGEKKNEECTRGVKEGSNQGTEVEEKTCGAHRDTVDAKVKETNMAEEKKKGQESGRDAEGEKVCLTNKLDEQKKSKASGSDALGGKNLVDTVDRKEENKAEKDYTPAATILKERKQDNNNIIKGDHKSKLDQDGPIITSTEGINRSPARDPEILICADNTKQTKVQTKPQGSVTTAMTENTKKEVENKTEKDRELKADIGRKELDTSKEKDGVSKKEQGTSRVNATTEHEKSIQSCIQDSRSPMKSPPILSSTSVSPEHKSPVDAKQSNILSRQNQEVQMLLDDKQKECAGEAMHKLGKTSSEKLKALETVLPSKQPKKETEHKLPEDGACSNKQTYIDSVQKNKGNTEESVHQNLGSTKDRKHDSENMQHPTKIAPKTRNDDIATKESKSNHRDSETGNLITVGMTPSQEVTEKCTSIGKSKSESGTVTESKRDHTPKILNLNRTPSDGGDPFQPSTNPVSLKSDRTPPPSSVTGNALLKTPPAEAGQPVIDENYDSDFDAEAGNQSSQERALLEKLSLLKRNEKKDGPGYLFVFSDTPAATGTGKHRVRIGVSRFPEKRLQQALLFNPDIHMVISVAVAKRVSALAQAQEELKSMSLRGKRGWYWGSLEVVLKSVTKLSEEEASL